MSLKLTKKQASDAAKIFEEARNSPAPSSGGWETCPLQNKPHSEHDEVIVRVTQRLAEAQARIKTLEAVNILIPDATEKDRTSQVLAQRCYELQKNNAYLRQKLGLKGDE